MANEKNLKHFTKENAKEMGRKGGIASGKSRYKSMIQKLYLEVLLEKMEKGKIKPMSMREIKKALKKQHEA